MYHINDDFEFRGGYVMERDRMARAMIDTLLSKAMKDIKNDPERGFRNTVDLVLNLQRGNFSKTLFTMVQKMLTDQSSAYYRLIKNISDNVKDEYFKEFALNVGYNSCASGAKKVKEKESELGINVPWCISIFSSADKEWSEFTDSIVTQGKALGVYLYQIRNEMAFSEQAIKIYKKHKDCAFVLLVDSSEVTDKSISSLSKVSNILISITGSSYDDMARAADILNKHERFFAAHMTYDDNNYEELLSDSTLKTMENFTNSFVFYIPGSSCSEAVFDKTRQIVRNIRDSQHYAYVIMDMKADIADIDKTISNHSSSVFFKEDGTIISSDGSFHKESYSMIKPNLVEILK